MLSPLQTVEKKNSLDRRVVVDLSFPLGQSVNDGIPTDNYLDGPFSLSYPTVDNLTNLIREKGPGCFLYKRDLRRAYRQIPVDPHDYFLLGYSWKDMIFFDTKLPFGLRMASIACQRTTNAVRYIFEQEGGRCVNYLDDIGGVESPDKAEQSFQQLGKLLQELGLEESPEKACPPAPVMTFLGRQFNTIDMTIRIPDDKLTEIKQYLPEWMSRKRATKRDLQSLIGRLAFLSGCVRPGRVFVSRLLDTLRKLRRNHHRFHVNKDMKKDIQWWISFLDQFNGVSMIPTEYWCSADELLTTDACLTGAGGTFMNEYFHCPFPPAVIKQNYHISCLEIMAVMVACKLWANKLSGHQILIQCDNEATVHVLNAGRTRDPVMLDCVREVWFVAAKYQFHIKAIHIAGCNNRKADILSRWDSDDNSYHKFTTAVGGSEATLPGLAALQRKLTFTMSAAYAQGTLRNFRSQWKTYFLFCLFYGLKPVPASPTVLSLFIQFLSETTKNIGTLRNYLNAIRILHELNGFDGQVIHHLFLHMTLQGVSHLYPQVPKQKLAITPDILLTLHGYLDLSRPLDLTLWAAFLTAFHLFLRKSNLVPPTKAKFDPTKHLARRNFKFTDLGVIIALTWSKTNQNRTSVHSVPILQMPNSPLCLVTALRDMFQSIPAPLTAPAFVYPSTRGLVTLTHSSFTAKLRSLLDSAGFNSKSYSGHSFRRGGATAAFSAHVPGELVRSHGDWKSQAYLLYLQIPFSKKLEVSGRINNYLCSFTN
ncbi:uncharacterized protein LOC144439784 [Glandiceps talaboti]